MSAWQRLTIFVAALGGFSWAVVCSAEERVHAVSSARIATALVQPSPLVREDHVYHQYVSSLDSRISREYLDRWNFHDLQQLYGASNDEMRHLNPGSLEFINSAPLEVDARRAFAGQVMRLRLEKAVTTFLNGKEGAMKGLRKAEQTINAVKNQTLRLSSSAKPSPFTGSIRYGYDLFTDFSKVEYACQAFDLGYYHSFLLSAATGSRSYGRAVFAQVAARPAETLPTPSLRYRFDNDSVEASLSKGLGPTMSASVTGVTPTRANGVQKSLGVSLSYRF